MIFIEISMSNVINYLLHQYLRLISTRSLKRANSIFSKYIIRIFRHIAKVLPICTRCIGGCSSTSAIYRMSYISSTAEQSCSSEERVFKTAVRRIRQIFLSKTKTVGMTKKRACSTTI